MMKNGNEVLKQHLVKRQRASTYISARIQNELNTNLFYVMRGKIVEEIEQAIFFQFWRMKLQIVVGRSKWT